MRTTTALPLPPQCTSSATLNLTESWRNNYNNTDLRNEDGVILLAGVTWFRFSGAAGNLLRNSCPPSGQSCGSDGGYWSDSPLPTGIGETVNITFYEKYSTGSCDDNGGAQIGRATRCSADRGGIVYIMDVTFDSSYDTVCSMDWTRSPERKRTTLLMRPMTLLKFHCHILHDSKYNIIL